MTSGPFVFDSLGHKNTIWQGIFEFLQLSKRHFPVLNDMHPVHFTAVLTEDSVNQFFRLSMLTIILFGTALSAGKNLIINGNFSMGAVSWLEIKFARDHAAERGFIDIRDAVIDGKKAKCLHVQTDLRHDWATEDNLRHSMVAPHNLGASGVFSETLSKGEYIRLEFWAQAVSGPNEMDVSFKINANQIHVPLTPKWKRHMFLIKTTEPTRRIYFKQLKNYQSRGAGMFRLARVSAERVDARLPKVTLTADREEFLPGENNIRFIGRFKNREVINRWSLIVGSPDGKEIWSIQGQGNAPLSLPWDGKDRRGRLVQGGRPFKAMMTGTDLLSRKWASNILNVRSKIPAEVAVTLSFKDPSFNPGIDKIPIRIQYKNAANIRKWQLTITNNAGRAVYLHKSAKRPPKHFIWNGRDDKDNAVEGGDVFSAQLTGTDKYKRTWQSNIAKVKSEIKIEKYEELMVMKDPDSGITTRKKVRGLKFKLTNIEFESNSAELKDTTRPIMEMVAAVLKKYNAYMILIQGHTDMIGGTVYNKRLSRERAKNVGKYLNTIFNIEERRIQCMGYGLSNPIASNETEEGRAKNRRVEFKLIQW